MSAPARRGRVLPALIIGAGALWVWEQSGPILSGPHIDPIPAAAAFFAALSASTLTAAAFRLLGDVLNWLRARRPTGLKGTAGWVRSLPELRDDLVPMGWGPYWGSFGGQPVMADYASNALTLGPAGTGKGVGVIQPTVMAIRSSKIVVDFKGELSCVLADALRARGETVKILNIGDMWTDRLGPSEAYNPLALIADDFWREGGLQDVSDDVHELGLQLYPEPGGASAGDGNRYFRDGSRDLIGFAIQMCVLVQGYEATLGDVAAMLNDRESLLRHAQWASGRLAIEEDMP